MNKKISIFLFIIFVITSLFFLTSYLIKDTQKTNINNSDNFSKIGNLSLEGNQWKIVYEEPGAPALVKYLEFNNQSKCFSVSCDENQFEIGERVEVKGLAQEDKVIVSLIEKIQNKGTDNIIDDCIETGGVIMYPDCPGCEPYCSFDEGDEFREVITEEDSEQSLCVDSCGNGVCEEIVCLGSGCPCPEDFNNCPSDCL